MAPHPSILAWKIPWMEEPGRLQSMGSLRVRHNWATWLSNSTFMHWRRKWQPTPVFLPGESQGRGSLVGCRLWGRTESDTTEQIHFHFHYGCESWTVKKAEHRRIDAFELWCWRSLLRVPWTARRSNQSILKKSFLNTHWKEWSETEAPIFWPPDAKSWLIRKDPDAGKDWRQEKGMTEDEMLGWHHRLNGHEFEQAPWVGDRQGSLACCSPWGHIELDTTEQ